MFNIEEKIKIGLKIISDEKALSLNTTNYTENKNISTTLSLNEEEFPVQTR